MGPVERMVRPHPRPLHLAIIIDDIIVVLSDSLLQVIIYKYQIGIGIQNLNPEGM